MEKLIAIIVLIIQLSNALNENSCRDAKTAENFDLSSFARGSWYLYARYPNEIESNDRVHAYQGRHLRGNTYKFKSELPQSSPDFSVTDVMLDSDFNTTGDINVKLSYINTGKTITFTTKIPIFDAKKHIFAYSCTYDDRQKLTKEYAWIAVRSKTIDDKHKELINELINSSSIFSSDKFIVVDRNSRQCRTKKCAGVE